MTVHDLPTLNATLNTISAFALGAGFIFIKRGQREYHRRAMLAACICSLLFLTSYLIYHQQVGSVPYPHHDWTRPLYFAILIPHVILAGIMLPFILALLWLAWHNRFDRHKRLARWVFPGWVFVSVSGIAIYFMLYQL